MMITVRRILMATDFSNCSKEALGYASHLAKRLKANLFLIHVFELPVYSDIGVAPSVRPEVQRWLRELKAESARRLEALAKATGRQGVNVRPLIREGSPFLEILEAARELPADLIVLGTHGRTGLAHVVMGSVAERVVRNAPCPVLTVRPKALRRKTP
jgi:nucleotide-binding universal stress UspA family protein